MTNPLDLSTAAAALGRKGGQSTSEAKQAASRANGKHGGSKKGGIKMFYAAESSMGLSYTYDSPCWEETAMNALPEWMTMPKDTPINQRFYFRCHDCLMTVCIALTTERNDLKCGVCGGRLDLMGQVEGNRWVHKAEKCTCNEMCQDARGPKCTCSCGGENHGKGYRYYTYTDSTGTIHVKADQDTNKLMTIANEYRAAEQAAVDRIHALPHYNDYSNGIYIPSIYWHRIHDAINMLNEARKGVNQKNRIAKLNKVAQYEEQYTGVLPS